MYGSIGKRRLALVVGAVLAVAATSPALAAGQGGVEEQLAALRLMLERQQALLESQQQQLEAQRRQLDAQRVELDALRGATPAGGAPAVARDAGTPSEPTQQRVEKLERALAEAKLAAQESPRVQMNATRPTITSADGRSSVALRVNVQADVAQHDQEPPGPLATDFRRGSVGGGRENDAARDLSDGAYFRRARLGVEGTIARDFNYRLLIEYGGPGTEGPARINDAYVAYTGFAPFVFQVGAWSPPANLADGTSTEDLVMIERASPAELSRALGGADGRFGIGMRVGGERWLGALTFTGRAVNDPESFDSQSAVVGRLGGLVISHPDHAVHLGVNGTYVLHAPDQSSSASLRYPVRFRDRPELREDSTRLIDSGAIDAAHAYAAGLEFAAHWKNLQLQAENYWYGIERRDSPLPDPRFGGWYVEASWVLTGERRRYTPATAAYQGPRPRVPFDGRGGWGAWELGARYSHTDLNFREGAPGTAALPEAVRGGEQSIYGVALNWYLNANVKLMFDWMRVDVDRLNPAGPANPTPFGPPPATPPLGVEIGQQFDVYAVRSQFAF